MLRIIQKRKIYLVITGIIIVASIVLLAVWGLKAGIDFTGGTLMEIEFRNERPDNQKVREALSDLGLGQINIQTFGERGLIFRLKEINEAKHQELLDRLEINFGSGKSRQGGAENLQIINQEGEPVGLGEIKAEVVTDNQIIEHRFESIGPAVGDELKRKSIYAIIVAAIGIIIYIAWSFRKVSKPVSSWKYGIAAIVALIHDILLVCGVFILLGRYLNYEVDAPFIAALLTVLGYSVNDTIVVFDRIRENLPRSEENFENTVNASINQTMARSINTSLTTLLALVAIYFFGGETVKSFVLALIIGITTGTYSSIFIASPLLVSWHKWSNNRHRA